MEKEVSTGFISAALLGVSILGIIEGLLGQARLTDPLRLSLYAFAFSIPLLAMAVLKPGFKQVSHGTFGSRNSSFPLIITEIIGWLASITGIAAIIWHLSEVAIWVFVGSIIFGLVVRILLPFLLFMVFALVDFLKTLFRNR